MHPKLSAIEDYFRPKHYTDEELFDSDDYNTLLVNQNLLQVLVNRVPSSILQELVQRHRRSTLTMTALYKRTNEAYSFVASQLGVSRNDVKQAMKKFRAARSLLADKELLSSLADGHVAGSGKDVSIGTSKHNAAGQIGNACEDMDVPLFTINAASEPENLRFRHDHRIKDSIESSQLQDVSGRPALKKLKLINKGAASGSPRPSATLKTCPKNISILTSTDSSSVKLLELCSDKPGSWSYPSNSPRVRLGQPFCVNKRAIPDFEYNTGSSVPKVPKLKLNSSRSQYRGGSFLRSQHNAATNGRVVTSTPCAGSLPKLEPTNCQKPAESSNAIWFAEKKMSPKLHRSPRSAGKYASSRQLNSNEQEHVFVCDSTTTRDTMSSTRSHSSTALLPGQIHFDDTQARIRPSESDLRNASTPGQGSDCSSPLSSLGSSPEMPTPDSEDFCAQDLPTVMELGAASSSSDDCDDLADGNDSSPPSCSTMMTEQLHSPVDSTLRILESDIGFLLELTDVHWERDAKMTDHDQLLRAAARYTVFGIVTKANSFKPKNLLTVRMIHDRIGVAKRVVAMYRGISKEQVDKEYKQACIEQAKQRQKTGVPARDGGKAEDDAYYSPAGSLFYKGQLRRFA